MEAVSQTLQYNYKPKVTGYYELAQANITGTTPVAFNANEQLVTFDIASGARGINWSTFDVPIGVKLQSLGNQVGKIVYFKKSNTWISRAVLRSKAGRYAIDLTECFAYSSTMPHRCGKKAIDFNSMDIHGDQYNDLNPGITAANRTMQEDFLQVGTNASTSDVLLIQNNHLGDALGGIFNKNKDVPLTTGFFLDIYLAPVQHVAYQIASTTAYADATASVPLVATDFVVLIDSLRCNFRQQADDQINVGMFEYLQGTNKQGIPNSLLVPFDYVQCQIQNTNSSTSHNISQPITTNIGDKLKKIYYMVGRASDNSNGYALRYGSTTFNNTTSISQITLTLNNRTIGIYDIDKGDHSQFDYGMDILSNKKYEQLMGVGTSVNRGLKVVNNNFFIPIDVENLSMFEDQKDSNTGLPILSDSNFTAKVTLNGIAVPLIHRIWMVGTKYMEIKKEGIQILP